MQRKILTSLEIVFKMIGHDKLLFLLSILEICCSTFHQLYIFQRPDFSSDNPALTDYDLACFTMLCLIAATAAFFFAFNTYSL